MKYIKLFERQKSLKLEPLSYYIIYGNIESVMKILLKIAVLIPNEEKKDFNNFRLRISQEASDIIIRYPKHIGIILYHGRGFSHTVLKSERDRDLLFKRGFNGVYRNGGEIKIENDEIVIDTLERDMESYNL